MFGNLNKKGGVMSGGKSQQAKYEAYKTKILNNHIRNVRMHNYLKKKNKNFTQNLATNELNNKVLTIKEVYCKKYFIINNNLTGGSYKWQRDIEQFIPLVRIDNYNMLVKILQNHYDTQSIIILINSFINTDFTNNKIIELHKKYKFNLILPIHEWGWFNNSTEWSVNYHSIYLNENITLSENSKNLFDICSKIICPSNFMYDIFLKYYPNEKIQKCEWIDYALKDISCNYNVLNPHKITPEVVNIGVLTINCEVKGEEQVRFLLNEYRYNNNIKLFVVDINIEKYKDNYNSFIGILKKYKIHGLLYLNKYGESWCYGLSKGLACGLPILYNNFGSFKERIPKNKSKYIINNNNESEFHDSNMLINNFTKLITYIKNNEIFLNDIEPKNIKNSKLIDIILDKKKIKKYAVYFPQFHKISENDINFYENYTDIRNLNMLSVDKKETPNNKLLGINNILEYDLIKNDKIINKQIELIQNYNIDGFAMYYYWFSKNTVTNKNTIMYDIHEKFLSKDLKQKKIFYIWANENWSDNAAFGNSGHIIKNDYTEDNFNKNTDLLLSAFSNKNYLKIDNKPVFYIHHPWFIEEILLNKFTQILNDKCIKNGFDGVLVKVNNMNKIYENGYNFHPNYKKTKTIKVIDGTIKLDYKEYINHELIINSKINTVFFDFDNRARLFKPNKLDKSTICINNTETEFRKFLEKIKNSNTEILLINAWNEWGEKMHIEPSEEKGDYYLKLINEYI